MLEHVSLPVSDYKKSKDFYTKTLAPLGYTNNMEFGEAAGFMEGGHTSFWINKKERVVASHVAFLAKSTEEVQKFYDAALSAGGTDNGAPGFRHEYGDDYYAAFVLDPDGNNIEACFFGEKAPK